MAFDHNVGGHAFDFDTRACTVCGMTQEEFRDKNQPACTGPKIFADASQPATLRHGNTSVDCYTLQEAVLAWMRLPEKDRAQATIKVNVPGGPTYTAAEIDRLHIAASK